MNGDSASYTIDDKNNQNLPPPYSANLGRVNPTFDVGSNDFILVEEVRPRRKVSVKEKMDSVLPWMEHRVRKGLTMKSLKKRLPITRWLPGYSRDDAAGDLVAGLTVGLTVIPQSLAYAAIAGLPAEYGLYGSFLGCIMYIFIGSCKDVPMGPTAIVSLLTYQVVKGAGPAYATLLCFLSGVIQLIMGISGLGIIIDFVSGPVSSGFTSAVALIIISSQIKDLLAIKTSGTTFVQMWISIFKDIEHTHMGDAVLGGACIIILLLMRLLGNVKIGPEDEDEGPTRIQKLINSSLWLISTARNAIIVLLSGLLGFYFTKNSLTVPFNLIGHIPPGLPEVSFPPFSGVNIRTNQTVDFIDMVSDMGSGIVVLPLVALLENIAICKTFAHGKPVDSTQELIAIGLCNIGNSFVCSFPGSGSLSRSAVNNASGVRTPLGGLYTGVLVILALLFFTPYFYFIPKAALAAVIVAAVIFMVEVDVVKPIYRSKKSDLIPGLSTFGACLILPLEIGILVGIGLNLISILYHAARPKISMEIHNSRAGIEYLLLTPDRCLIFPSVAYVRNLVTKHSIKQGIPVVIDCSHIYGADFTAAKVIEVLTEDFSKRGQPLFFYNLKPSVVAVFEGVQPTDFVVYYDKHDLDHLLRSKMVASQDACFKTSTPKLPRLPR
nr:PREDICTED: sodium-independent sulfate anion transporter isoform X1 [Bemisia tabaci]XP_018904586.1 PREDICTED: sodium-independent sulfate anion transporter isoform X1 [Bemisia tabaci]XP_018904587.1 PREDICTED: sodium-independent sulfate anion transporter isoform X1 [Bemisia tabaci]XP_018904588.1 PREDICTED: sodium-independent sulfate anion transporter isoform X1 [Bemisia tabaci]XP_018904589.1 PREDICTED: sodium-independent sulfate anion transporter isoform X1 [Bemisia tabaci]